jgi:hypothetical protein
MKQNILSTFTVMILILVYVFYVYESSLNVMMWLGLILHVLGNPEFEDWLS